MQPKRSKLLMSFFVGIISLIFSSLCITIAWFTSVTNYEPNTGILAFGSLRGNLYYYNGNFEKDSEDVKSFYGYDARETMTLSGSVLDNFTKYDINSEVNPFVTIGLLPNVRHTFLIELTSVNLGDLSVDFNIDEFESGMAIEDYEQPQTESGGNIYLTEAMAMYVSDPYLAESMTISQASNFIFKESSETDDCFNATTGTNNTGSPITLKTLSLNQDTVYYVMFSFEFSNASSTYYARNNDGTYTKSTTGTSNVYQAMYFSILKMSFSWHTVAPIEPAIGGNYHE